MVAISLAAGRSPGGNSAGTSLCPSRPGPFTKTFRFLATKTRKGENTKGEAELGQEWLPSGRLLCSSLSVSCFRSFVFSWQENEMPLPSRLSRSPAGHSSSDQTHKSNQRIVDCWSLIVACAKRATGAVVAVRRGAFRNGREPTGMRRE